MGSRITISICAKIAKKNGGKILSKHYVNAKSKMTWQCAMGHKWDACYDHIRSGSWCHICNGGVRKTIEECHLLAKNIGGECLSTKYINQTKKLKWKCKCGNIFYRNYKSVKRGSWCQKCSNKTAITLEYCMDFARKRDGYCRSKEYKNTKIHMLWECKFGHQWKSSFENIKSGCWCPNCNLKKKKTLKFCIELAKKYDGFCLEKKYINLYSDMRWECKNGHIFKSRLSNIQKGIWCPKCYNKKKTYDIGDCALLAKKFGGKCLDKQYKNIYEDMSWECKNKHIFKKKLSDILRGYWCPVCVSSRGEFLIYHILREKYPNLVIHSRYFGFDWLRSKNGGKQHLDLYIPELKLAIEYDGEQHFEPVNFGGISDDKAILNLKKTQRLDREKEEKIKNHPEDIKYFVRFSYKEKINKKHVTKKLIKNGIL